MAFPIGPDGEPTIFVQIYHDYLRKQRARLILANPELGWEGEVFMEHLALEPIPVRAAAPLHLGGPSRPTA